MQKMRLVCGLILMFALVEGTQAQSVGGLIKKKVDQAKAKTAPAANAKEAEQEPSLFPFQPNAEAMASYKRGLDVEIAGRNEYRDRLAKLKTVEEYETCETASLTSPDGIKFAEEVVSRMEKAKTPEDYAKLSDWQVESYKAIAVKLCGEDPRPVGSEQGTVFAKAAEAGAKEAGKGWTSPSQNEGGNLRDYRLMKELVAKYCSLPADTRQDAEKNGIKVPGTGANIFWVFPLSFTQWVGPECENLTKLQATL